MCPFVWVKFYLKRSCKQLHITYCALLEKSVNLIASLIGYTYLFTDRQQLPVLLLKLKIILNFRLNLIHEIVDFVL